MCIIYNQKYKKKEQPVTIELLFHYNFYYNIIKILHLERIDYIMTNLELMICEAENAGEIDLDTRDMMLGILNESTAQYRAVERIDDEIGKIKEKIDRLKKIAQSYADQGNTRMCTATKQKIATLANEIMKLEAKKDKIDPYGHANSSKEFGSEAGRNKAVEGDTERTLKSKMRGSLAAGMNEWRGNSKRPPEQKGRFKTTNGLKESVLEEIYEAELCGDITPEERMSLIDYMDM